MQKITNTPTALHDLEWYLGQADSQAYGSRSNYSSMVTASWGLSGPESPEDPCSDAQLGWARYKHSGGHIARANRLRALWGRLEPLHRVILRARYAPPIRAPRAVRERMGELAEVVMAIGLETGRDARRAAKAALEAAQAAWCAIYDAQKAADTLTARGLAA